MKIVIVLPTYNERQNISKLIPKIASVAAAIRPKHSLEVLVVDDRSPDGTAEEVRRLSAKYSFLSLLTGEKKGLGMAYVRGMNFALYKMKADVMFEMDADFSHDPAKIPEFIREIEKGADFVIGSRYIQGGSIPKEWAYHRKVFSVVGNLIVRYGLFIPSIHEWTNGYRAFRANVFRAVGEGLSRYPGYTFQVAFLHRVVLAKCVIREIPLVFIDRSWGESKIVPPDYIYNLIVYILTHSSLIRFIIVGGVGFLIQVVVASILVAVHIFPGIAVSIGAELAIISNFIFNNSWTFAHKKLTGKKKILKRFSAFNTAGIGSILTQGLVVSIGVVIFGRSSWFVLTVLTIIFLIIPYSFFIYNAYIWKTHEN